jgi:hypothetical protein
MAEAFSDSGVVPPLLLPLENENDRWDILLLVFDCELCGQ